MTGILSPWKRLRGCMQGHAAELRLSVRVTAGALISFALSELFRLPLILWPVLTSVIVTQLSIGKSLKAALDYFAGTLGGAAYAGAVSALIPQQGEGGIFAALSVAVAPLTFLAALNPSFSTAPISAVIVVLAPLVTHGGPIESACFRVIEVALGTGTGLLVSIAVLPARAHGLALGVSLRALSLMGKALRELLGDFEHGYDQATIRGLYDQIGKAVARLEAAETEARREQVARLANDPELLPLLRILVRLRHDLIMIGRAAGAAFPDRLRKQLASPLAALAEAAAEYFERCAAALERRRAAPPLGAVELASADYENEISGLSEEGGAAGLPGGLIERLFALGFAIEQLCQDLAGLRQRINRFVKKG